MHSKTYNLTADEREALRAVCNGADVYAYDIAKALRAVQQKAPELVHIVNPAYRPPGHMRQPYFGAIVTKAGFAALRQPARTIRAVNGIGPGAGPNARERIEQRNREQAQRRKAQEAREAYTDWHTLAMQEGLAEKGA